jgi:hypothetical protein
MPGLRTTTSERIAWRLKEELPAHGLDASWSAFPATGVVTARSS